MPRQIFLSRVEPLSVCDLCNVIHRFESRLTPKLFRNTVCLVTYPDIPLDILHWKLFNLKRKICDLTSEPYTAWPNSHLASYFSDKIVILLKTKKHLTFLKNQITFLALVTALILLGVHTCRFQRIDIWSTRTRTGSMIRLFWEWFILMPSLTYKSLD